MTSHLEQGPFWLDTDPAAPFPPVELALRDPDGLLAAGGDLTPTRLLNAYRNGIFPWYSDGQPILWWSPDPRSVIHPAQVIVNRSLRKALRRQDYAVTLDVAFDAVISACAEQRSDNAGTWITTEMHVAYQELHRLGYAHSVEVWRNARLIGGLYGIAVGRVFFGESMFSRVSNASKIGFVYLCRQLEQWGFPLVDCQVASQHLDRLGARNLPRDSFMQTLNEYCEQDGIPGSWTLDPALKLEWQPSETNHADS